MGGLALRCLRHGPIACPQSIGARLKGNQQLHPVGTTHEHMVGEARKRVQVDCIPRVVARSACTMAAQPVLLRVRSIHFIVLA